MKETKTSFMRLLFLLLLSYSSVFAGESVLSQAKSFINKNKMNKEICVLIDMSVHSGKNRLIVYDLKGDSIMGTGLVAHGCGRAPWGEDTTKERPVFSNENGSHLSSLGKYKVGARGYSNWGINVNYKLHGLEVTNSNAFKRLIVLHGWEDVSNTETYPAGAPEGWGYPAVSNDMMRFLDKHLKGKKDVLFWIYQ